MEIFKLIYSVVSIVNCLFSVYFLIKIEKSKASKNSPLTSNEKIVVILTEILTPVISGAIYYYGLHDRFPKKASQANKYSWIVFGLIMLVFLLFGFFSYPASR